MLGDVIGLLFFTIATLLAGVAALENPTLLAWLSVAHNGLLAAIYARRRPAVRTDRLGLCLGLMAAFLPLAAYPPEIPPWLLIPGLAGYLLTLWSLWTLGRSFGIAPADRGLVQGGPYRLVRHPMYLGELLFRLVLVGATLHAGNAALLLALILLQVARIRREEQIIAGYARYARTTRWRLLPGIW